MNQFRSEEKELLDLGPEYYSKEEYEHCMKMLFRVNRLFGFFHGTVKLLNKMPVQNTLLDVGCGGGLFLLHLSQYFPFMWLKGSDTSKEAISQAQQELSTWQKNNFANQVSFSWQPQPQLTIPENSIDIILTTLVCHHLSDDELPIFLKNAWHGARYAVIINDLHRHTLAHWFYALLSPLLFRNRLITHDGLISIRRGFTRKEWHTLLAKANIKNYVIKWCFPFRWQVILWKNSNSLKGM